MHVQLGQIMSNKIQKDRKNPTATSEELGAKPGHCACLLHSTPPKGGKPPKPPTLLVRTLDIPLPLPYTRNMLAPPRGASKGTHHLFFLPPAAAGAPIKPCLHFLSGLRLISIDWGRPRTLVSVSLAILSQKVITVRE